VSIGQLAAITVSCFLARELWSGVAFVPWSVHKQQEALETDRLVRRDDKPLAYWLVIGVHTVMVSLCWFWVL
jgi:hypothetical protein